MAATHFIVKVTHECNLQCKYCYVDKITSINPSLRSSVMPVEMFYRCIDAAMRNASNNNLEKIHIILHGGEPLLAGLPVMMDYIGRVRALEKKYRIGIVLSLQTNGVLLDDEWISFLKNHIPNVGISIDGPLRVHDACRIMKNGKGSFQRVEKNVNKVIDAGLNPGVLAVVQPGVNGGEVYRFFENIGIKRISFLVPAQNREYFVFPSEPDNTPVADYLIQSFDAWFESSRQDVMVFLFDATIRAIYGKSQGIPVIGSPPAEWISFSPDGSVEAGDCYGICDSKRIYKEDPLEAIHICEREEIYMLQKIGGYPTAPQCLECDFVFICKGGFLPHRYSFRSGYDNPSYYCHDLKKYFSHIIKRIQDMDEEMKK